MVIFNSSVKLPEGIYIYISSSPKTTIVMGRNHPEMVIVWWLTPRPGFDDPNGVLCFGWTAETSLLILKWQFLGWSNANVSPELRLSNMAWNTHHLVWGFSQPRFRTRRGMVKSQRETWCLKSWGIPGRHHGCFNTKSWSSMTWMIWEYPHFSTPHYCIPYKINQL